MDPQSPLIAALPPATDYLTYLTLIEYNLTSTQLPTLHHVLSRDEKLTINIGWDLVHLLLPLLPESRPCLDTVAQLGNPREVLLKVTESLRLLDWEAEEADEDEAEQQAEHLEQAHVHPALRSETREQNMTALPLVRQFETLLDMLATLHPRIKTKFPSRFVSTTVQAVLASMSRAPAQCQGQLVAKAMDLVAALEGFAPSRPPLPPRQSSEQVPQVPSKPRPAAGTTASAADPEAETLTRAPVDGDIQHRLLQSFVTHVAELYLCSLTSDEDIPGLSLSSRLQEGKHPERSIPGKKTFSDRFLLNEDLAERDKVFAKFVHLAKRLGLTASEMLKAASEVETLVPDGDRDEDEPPQSAADIPLSQSGAVMLLAGQETLDTTGGQSDFETKIFPHHARLVRATILSPETAGSEPEALIDSVVALGLLAISRNEIGEPKDDEDFTGYLQLASLLSANSPSPSLRGHAYYLVTTVLRSHPSDIVRLAFIRDTLEHCPYENLRASAISWVKGEIVEATQSADGHDNEVNVFNTSIALHTLSPFLFPSLTAEFGIPMVGDELVERWTLFKTNLSFYLAALNFYFLLLSAPHVRNVMNIRQLHQEADIGVGFLAPLRAGMEVFRAALRGDEDQGALFDMEGKDGAKAGMMDLMLLEDAIDRVEKGVLAMNKTDT